MNGHFFFFTFFLILINTIGLSGRAFTNIDREGFQVLISVDIICYLKIKCIKKINTFGLYLLFGKY